MNLHLLWWEVGDPTRWPASHRRGGAASESKPLFFRKIFVLSSSFVLLYSILNLKSLDLELKFGEKKGKKVTCLLLIRVVGLPHSSATRPVCLLWFHLFKFYALCGRYVLFGFVSVCLWNVSVCVWPCCFGLNGTGENLSLWGWDVLLHLGLVLWIGPKPSVFLWPCVRFWCYACVVKKSSFCVFSVC